MRTCTILLFILPTFLIAQKSTIKKTRAALMDGDYEMARGLIDEAVLNKKGKESSEIWYLYGEIYSVLSKDSREEEKLIKAEQGYSTAIEKEDSTSAIYKQAVTGLEELFRSVFNSGVREYQDSKFEKAINSFRLASLLNPKDTTSYLYGAASALEIKDFEKAIDNYINWNKVDPNLNVYRSLITIYKVENQNFDKALEVVNEAKSHFPKSKVLDAIEIDLLLLTEQILPAKAKIEKALVSDPNNYQLHLWQGIIFDDLIVKERQNKFPDVKKIFNYSKKAEESYLKSIQLNPTDFTANLRYAMMLKEKAETIQKELDQMPAEALKDKEEALQKEVQQLLEKGLPYLENAHKMDMDDLAILEALKIYCERLGLKERLEEIQIKIDKIQSK